MENENGQDTEEEPRHPSLRWRRAYAEGEGGAMAVGPLKLEPVEASPQDPETKSGGGHDDRMYQVKPATIEELT